MNDIECYITLYTNENEQIPAIYISLDTYYKHNIERSQDLISSGRVPIMLNSGKY